MTTKPFVIPEKVIDLMFVTAAKHEREFCELQKMLPTYCWSQLKFRPLSVTLLKEFTRHQLCNLRTQIMSSLFSYLYFNARRLWKNTGWNVEGCIWNIATFYCFFTENKFAEPKTLSKNASALFSPVSLTPNYKSAGSTKASPTCLDIFQGRVTAPRSHAVISIDLLTWH